MSDREAIDTITGYFYQFDKTILEILGQSNNKTSICIEGIEDIDVDSLNGSNNAIQCKYHAKAEYNHSEIKKPIALMLRHYAKNKDKNIKYLLYGHFKSGHEKLGSISVEDLKKNFLTTKSTEKKDSGKKIVSFNKVYEELSLSDSDLDKFLKNLVININAPSFSEQYICIIDAIVSVLNVSRDEAEGYHYNAALKLIRILSTNQNIQDRRINKSEFIQKISAKDEIFDSWFIRRKGRDKYVKFVKKEKLTCGLNMSHFDRFFLVDCTGEANNLIIKDVIYAISRKWAKISDRQNPSFCSAIFLHGIDPILFKKLKNDIYNEGLFFTDGYPFNGASFSVGYFYVEPTMQNNIKFRLINDANDLNAAINNAQKKVEIYQFHNKEMFFKNENFNVYPIKIEDLTYIKDMMK